MGMAVNPKFGRWVFELAEKKGISQAELARRMRYSPATVNGVIMGKSAPGSEFCKRLAVVLEVPEEVVLRMAGKMRQVTVEQATVDELRDILNQLTPEQRQELLEIGRLKIRLSRKDD